METSQSAVFKGTNQQGALIQLRFLGLITFTVIPLRAGGDIFWGDVEGDETCTSEKLRMET